MKLRNFFKTVLVLPFAGMAAVPVLASLGNRKLLVETPLDRVCVRRLIVGIKKYMCNTSKHYIFDPADHSTMEKMTYQFGGYFKTLVRRKALKSYAIDNIKSNGNSFSFDVYLQPINSPDFIILNTKLEKS